MIDIYDKEEVEIISYSSGTDDPNKIKYKGYYWFSTVTGGRPSWHQVFPPTDGCSECFNNGACKKCQENHYHYQPPNSFQSNNLAFCKVCHLTYVDLTKDESWRISYAGQPCPDCVE